MTTWRGTPADIDPLLETPDKSALRVYASDEFVEHVLDGLDTWGKPKYAAIKGLIKRVGAPFAEPLLQKLADEPSMSKRRLFIECLQDLGEAAANRSSPSCTTSAGSSCATW